MLRKNGGKVINVNELRSALSNIQISFKEDVVYENGIVQLNAFKRREVRE